jgi:hypothetical protein
MADTTYTQETPTPNPDLQSLDRLVGTWTVSGPDIDGQVTYEWMEGGFFLIQHVDFVHGGRKVKGLEVIGHLKPFMEEPSADIKSRYYDALGGDTLDYVYEIRGDTLTIWGGERGSPAYFQGTFSPDGNTCAGAWVYPGGGGYDSNMTRVR